METKERTEPAHQVHKRQGLTSPPHLPTPTTPHPPTQSSVNHSASLLWFIMCTHTPRTPQSSWAALSYYDLSASIFAFPRNERLNLSDETVAEGRVFCCSPGGLSVLDCNRRKLCLVLIVYLFESDLLFGGMGKPSARLRESFALPVVCLNVTGEASD